MAVSRERAFRATVIKLGTFAVVMLLIFVALVVVFSQYRSGSTYGYKATFTSASQLKSGSKVRIAGVEVGKVGSVGLNPDNEAVVEFDVSEKYRLPTAARALIRYENLTGDRFLELQEGTGDPTDLIGDGGSIPITQTEPALDLDKLLGGFKPLFRTLDPKEVNELSASLVQVFQGQGPALNELLAEHRDIHRLAGRPRSVDRRGHRQPQHHARHHRCRQRRIRQLAQSAAVADLGTELTA